MTKSSILKSFNNSAANLLNDCNNCSHSADLTIIVNSMDKTINLFGQHRGRKPFSLNNFLILARLNTVDLSIDDIRHPLPQDP